MRKSQSGTGSTNSSVNLEESIQQKRGQGQSLSEDIREPMEQAFGADFSEVKVHTDSQSDQLNRSIQARAFTTGQDVFFKQGEYNPGSKNGQELLAHELTHVVQQTGTVQRDDDPVKKEQKKSKSTIEELRDALGGWGADSAKVLQLLGKASASEKKQILADSKLMGQLQSKLSRREMIQALNALEAPLKQKLNAAMKGWGCDAQVIKDLTASAKDSEKKAVLADTALVNRLSSELSRAEMLVILGNLNAPIKDKLNAAMKGWGADAEAIKALTKGASDTDKQAVLNDVALVSRLSSELSRADMLVILDNLNAPVKDKLNAAMKGWGADAEVIRTLLLNATEAERNAVLTDETLMSRLTSELSADEVMSYLRPHLETKSANVSVVSDPSQPQSTVVRVLPINTRVVITEERNHQGAEWVKIRVTTGSDMGVEGWVKRSQLENRPETRQVTMETATRLFTELSQATFKTSTGTQSPIPFHYPVDGCYDRAHIMAQLLTEKGYASEKVFAISKKSGGRAGLRVPTDYAGDNQVPGEQPAVMWWYHVAPIIRVENDQGQVTEMVIDPSMTDQLITIDQWTGMMSSEAFNRMTVSEIQQLLQENQRNNPAARNHYPSDQNLVYTTDRNVYWPLGPNDSVNPTEAQAEAQHTGIRDTITLYSELAKVHELAAAIRRELRATPVNADNIVNAINLAPPIARQELWSQFPVLRQEIQNGLPTPGDMQLVEDAVNQP